MRHIYEKYCRLLDRQPNDHQLAYTSRVYEHMIRGKVDDKISILPIQAEGGFGKTFCLSVAAKAYHDEIGKQIIVVTPTTVLREQTMMEFIRIFGNDNVGMLRSSYDYTDPAAIKKIIEKISKNSSGIENFNPSDIDVLKSLSEEVKEIDVLISQPQSIPSWLDINDIRAKKTSDDIAEKNSEITSKPVVVMTTRMAMIGLTGKSENFLNIDNIGTIIFDEADTIMSMAEMAYNFELSIEQLRNIGERVKEIYDISEYIKIVNQIEHLIDENVNLGIRVLTGNTDEDKTAIYVFRKIKFQPQLKLLVGEFRKINSFLKDHTYMAGFQRIIDEIITDLTTKVTNEYNENLESKITPRLYLRRGHDDELYFGIRSLNPGRMINYLWKSMQLTKPDSIIMTSATLEAPHQDNNFKQFLRSTGIWETDCSVDMNRPNKFHLTDHGNLTKLVFMNPSAIPPFGKSDDDEDEDKKDVNDNAELASEWLSEIERMIRSAHADKKTLIVCQSYREMEILRGMISDLPVSIHGRGQKLPSFDGNNIIMTCHKEGINLPDLEVLVITRIPFPHKDTIDTIVKVAESENYDSSKQSNLWHQYLWNETASRLYQIINRAFRVPTQSVEVWIGDPRMPLPPRLRENFYTIAPHRKRFIDCIPKRFNRFDTAEVFR